MTGELANDNKSGGIISTVASQTTNLICYARRLAARLLVPLRVCQLDSTWLSSGASS